MVLEAHDLLDDLDALKALAIAKDLQIEKLRASLAQLKKLQFGHSSEKLREHHRTAGVGARGSGSERCVCRADGSAQGIRDG